jgi:hypothetical protein
VDAEVELVEIVLIAVFHPGDVPFGQHGVSVPDKLVDRGVFQKPDLLDQVPNGTIPVPSQVVPVDGRSPGRKGAVGTLRRITVIAGHAVWLGPTNSRQLKFEAARNVAPLKDSCDWEARTSTRCGALGTLMTRILPPPTAAGVGKDAALRTVKRPALNPPVRFRNQSHLAVAIHLDLDVRLDILN